MKRRVGLTRRTRLRSRHYRERRPDTYGPLFDAVKKEPCWGLTWVPGHRCSGRHTSHHEPPVGEGGTDHTGQLPTCEALHQVLDQRSLGETRRELLERIELTEERLQEIALGYVARAIERTALELEA